jgi:hypothetical protein
MIDLNILSPKAQREANKNRPDTPGGFLRTED